jgi:hypothetical protein
MHINSLSSMSHSEVKLGASEIKCGCGEKVLFGYRTGAEVFQFDHRTCPLRHLSCNSR